MMLNPLFCQFFFRINQFLNDLKYWEQEYYNIFFTSEATLDTHFANQLLWKKKVLKCSLIEWHLQTVCYHWNFIIIFKDESHFNLKIWRQKMTDKIKLVKGQMGRA